MYTEDDSKKSKKYGLDKKQENSGPYQVDDNYTDLDYQLYNETDEDNQEEKTNFLLDKKRIIKLAIILLLLIILSILIYFIVNTSVQYPDVKLMSNTITINAGESGAVAYEIVNTEERLPISFVSQNTDIVTVDEYGTLYGIKKGSTRVTMVYYVNGKRYEKDCDILVE